MGRGGAARFRVVVNADSLPVPFFVKLANFCRCKRFAMSLSAASMAAAATIFGLQQTTMPWFLWIICMAYLFRMLA